MKNNTKSSITLPPKELQLVEDLRKKIGAKTKVEVIRQGLRKLQEATDRELLCVSYSEAARAVRHSTIAEVKELDALSAEGLDKEGLDKEGLDKEGLDKEGLDKEGLDKE